MLDVVLEAFASNHQNAEKLFIDLIKKLKVLSTTLCQLVGFKLQSFQAEGVLKQAPIGLLRMVALILHHRLFELQDIYPHVPLCLLFMYLFYFLFSCSRRTRRQPKTIAKQKHGFARHRVACVLSRSTNQPLKRAATAAAQEPHRALQLQRIATTSLTRTRRRREKRTRRPRRLPSSRSQNPLPPYRRLQTSMTRYLCKRKKEKNFFSYMISVPDVPRPVWQPKTAAHPGTAGGWRPQASVDAD